MSEHTPVTVWLVDRASLRGPLEAQALVYPAKKGTNWYWAEITTEPKRLGWMFEVGTKCRIGTRAFLTQLAAIRFLQGEADRCKLSRWDREKYSGKYQRALRIDGPSIYKGNKGK